MDADGKLTSLKKAYADIILSISKEAAARVMASERKSARYQHELKVAKEEGVRMLLRLKQMMDCQVREAEVASLNQQKKIEELKAQLHEAEDIVKDLREDLEHVQAELGKLKNKKLQCNETSLPAYATVPCLSQRNECRKCHKKLICSCSTYLGSRDLPSIILRGKEPGQYRNGCTHRILACERNLLDGDFCLSEEIDEIQDKCNVREQEAGKESLTEPVSGAEILCELANLGSSQSFLHKRKRAIRRLRPCPDTAEVGLAKSSEKENNFVENCCEKTMCKDGVNEKMEFLREETEFSDPLLSPDCKADAEKVDLPLEGLESNSSDLTNGLSSQPVKERVIKYTFQRKRKRQELSGAEMNGSLETEKKTVDVMNSDQKMERVKSSLSMESSRESRRLAQVARQLISLSERKWWH